MTAKGERCASTFLLLDFERTQESPSACLPIPVIAINGAGSFEGTQNLRSQHRATFRTSIFIMCAAAMMDQVVTNSKVMGKPSVTVPAYGILRGYTGALIEVDLYRFTLTLDHTLMGLAQSERAEDVTLAVSGSGVFKAFSIMANPAWTIH